MYVRNEHKCKICEIGYSLNSTTFACDAVTEVNCEIFEINSKCKRCQTGKKLTNGVCSSAEVENCKIWNSGYTGCVLCAAGHYLDSSSVCQAFIIGSC